MAVNLQEMLSKRPVDRDAVESHKKRMIEETRAYRLRELRENIQLTQEALATVMHISQNRVSKIESGDIEMSKVDTLRRYVEALGGTLRVEVEFGDDRIRIA